MKNISKIIFCIINNHLLSYCCEVEILFMVKQLLLIVVQFLCFIDCNVALLVTIFLSTLFITIIGAKAISGSFYGKPNKAIHYGSVNCDGSEQVLINCLYVQYSLEHGKKLNIHVEVAGVNCQGNLTRDNISITNSLTTSISTHLTTTGRVQYISSTMTSTTISTGRTGLANFTRGTGVSDATGTSSEVVILSIGIIALIFGITALIIG